MRLECLDHDIYLDVANLDKLAKPEHRHWLIELLKFQKFRVAMLVLICAFEVYLTHFLKTRGWLVATTSFSSPVINPNILGMVPDN